MKVLRSSATLEYQAHHDAGGRPLELEHNYEVGRLQPLQGYFCTGEKLYQPCHQEHRSAQRGDGSDPATARSLLVSVSIAFLTEILRAQSQSMRKS